MAKCQTGISFLIDSPRRVITTPWGNCNYFWHVGTSAQWSTSEHLTIVQQRREGKTHLMHASPLSTLNIFKWFFTCARNWRPARRITSTSSRFNVIRSGTEREMRVRIRLGKTSSASLFIGRRIGEHLSGFLHYVQVDIYNFMSCVCLYVRVFMCSVCISGCIQLIIFSGFFFFIHQDLFWLLKTKFKLNTFINKKHRLQDEFEFAFSPQFYLNLHYNKKKNLYL